MSDMGQQMHDLCRELFPICRSITGDGFRQSLEILRRHIPNLEVFEVPSGTQCFDWEIPKEWNIRDAYIVDPQGNRLCEFKKSNLHVVGYSTPIDTTVSLEELQNHLYSLPEQPHAIPYITSYYNERWGFCIADDDRKKLKPGSYRVVIDSDLSHGSLTYGELIIPGETDEEIFLSSYLCHPSMANNELSGPVVTTFLAQWLEQLERRRFTYRIVIIPETIGSITYLSRNFERMREKVIAGFNITCVGDDRAFSYLPSRHGNTLADQAALHVLKNLHPDFKTYSYLERGSDERQYCSPGIDLPVCSIMRSKYACYPEYHTSLDDLSLITPDGLSGGYETIKKAIECLELNEVFQSTVLCEPQLGKRGLYPTISTKDTAAIVRNMMNFWGHADGTRNAIEIAEKINVPLWEIMPDIIPLQKAGLLMPAKRPMTFLDAKELVATQ